MTNRVSSALRRQLILSATTGITTGLLIAPIRQVMAMPMEGDSGSDDFWTSSRVLWLRRTGRDEHYRVEYWVDGIVDPDNYQRLCYILRDVADSTMAPIDVNLLNLLYGIQRWQDIILGRPTPLMINSGYRTLSHNNRLEGAARNSMHLYGRAADLTSPVFKPASIARMARHFGVGGIGSYSSFTHVDTGRVRFWRG